MSTKTMLILSDFHCGHVVGLTPKSYQPRVHDNAARYLYKQAKQRAELWNWFEYAINKIGAVDYLLVNGDCIDGKGERSGSRELLTADREEQVEMATDVIKHIKVKKNIYMTYGTPYHCGKEEDWEKVIAEKVSAAKIENEGHYDINGLQISAKHYIGNSTSPISSMTAMQRAQLLQILWSFRGQQPKANLIIRSHVHRCDGMIKPAYNFQGWITPGLQGLGSIYGTRQIDGLPVEFGFLKLNVTDSKIGNWHVESFLAPLEIEASSVIKL